MYDFDCEFGQVYSEKCYNCGKETQVSTQKDEYPEYYTQVHVKCDCGSSVEFNLPVT